MRLLIIVSSFFLLLSCQSNATQQDSKKEELPVMEVNSEPEQTTLYGKHCFISYFGEDPNYQDKTIVNLNITGMQVTGNYDWIPAEKDSARGTLKGTIKDNIIIALYDYIIEGSNQKEEMIFKLEANQLLIKKGELMEVEGVLKLKDAANAEFSEIIPRVDCE